MRKRKRNWEGGILTDRRGVANPVFAVVVVVLVAAFVYVTFVDNPFNKGTGIDFAYIKADGSAEAISEGKSLTLYPNELRLYKSSHDFRPETEIQGVRGSLWLKPDTGGGSETIVIEYAKVSLTTTPNIGVITSDGPYTSEEIQAGIRTLGLKPKTLDANQFLSFATAGEYKITWTYAGTGTIEGTNKTASWDATGTLTIYHRNDTLTITAGTTTSTFEIQ